VCHNGAGSGTLKHVNGVPDVAFLTSQAGAATYNSSTKTCSAVTCHGGGTTPPWSSTDVGCIACHGGPPGGPNGASYPNTANAHPKHTAPAGINCNTCHNGSGSGTPTHADGTVNVAFDNAKFGTPAIGVSGAGCSNVACHGGKTTPTWNARPANFVYDPTGANCTLNCHSVVDTVGNLGGQYINAYNGDNVPYGSLISSNLHNGHVYWAQYPVITPCTDCHGLASLQTTHFAQLYKGQRMFVPGDPQATGFAASTVTGTRIFSYSGAKGGCYNNCHGSGDVRNWFQ